MKVKACPGGPWWGPAGVCVDRKPQTPAETAYSSARITEVTMRYAQFLQLEPVPYPWDWEWRLFWATLATGTNHPNVIKINNGTCRKKRPGLKMECSWLPLGPMLAGRGSKPGDRWGPQVGMALLEHKTLRTWSLRESDASGLAGDQFLET